MRLVCEDRSLVQRYTVCKSEPLQSNESRGQSADSSKSCSERRVLVYLLKSAFT